MAARTTSGTRVCQPKRPALFAAWLTSASIATYTRLEIMRSTIGRSPVMAAPTAMPTNPFSEIGALHRRFGPSAAYGPSFCMSPMSSATSTTRGSRCISRSCASWIASR